MTFKTESRLRPAEVIEKYGGCLELAPIDKHFHDISVGLYVKDGVSTVWSYSRREGVEERLEPFATKWSSWAGWRRWRAFQTNCV